MERNGWVEASWGKNENNRRVRVYELTPDGAKQLEVELAGWGSFAEAITKVPRRRGRVSLQVCQF